MYHRSTLNAIRVAVIGVFISFGEFPARAQEHGGLDAQKIGAAAGTKATTTNAGVVRVAWPRSDAEVTVAGTHMPPYAGLTSWAAFQTDPRGGAMVMGDLVLLQDEVNPVMDVLLDGGLAVTGLHNHFFFDEPRVFFMHIGGQGPAEKLAGVVGQALAKSRAIRQALPQPPKDFGLIPPPKSTLTAQPLADVFGSPGESKDGMFKVVVGRSTTMSCGCKVGADMGVNTWAAFVGNDGDALVDGDFACLPGELQPTLKALRKAGINIVAIHNHMEDESPRVIFLHYWGTGRAVELARGVKSAIDAQKAVASSPPAPNG